MLPELPKRKPTDHKGMFGSGLLVGGSRGMAGAIALAGIACLKTGAGKVTVATPLESLGIVAGFEPSYMTAGLPDDDNGFVSFDAQDDLKVLFESATAVGIGPGLGQSDELIDLISWAYSRISVPMVVDADALNCLANNPKILEQPGGPRILTPHPGEMRRLLDDEMSSYDDLLHRTEVLARESKSVIVLKDHQTLITTGHNRIRNTTGNVGMATAGSGDVLTGVITGLLCQGMEPFEAAQLGCFIHGLAGDAGAKRVGKISLIASDIAHYIPKAIRAIGRRERRRRIKEQTRT